MDNPVSLPARSGEPTPARHGHALMHALMLVASFCWAANIVATKAGLEGFSALALAQLRVTGAGIIFLVLLLLKKGFSGFRVARRDWIILTLVGISGVTLNQLCFVEGVARSSVSHAGLIVALGPIMVLVLACAIRLEALTLPKFLGMLVAFGGVAVLTIGKTGQSNGGQLMGDLILLAGSAFFAVYTILVKEVAHKYDALTLNALGSVVGVPLMIPLSAGALAQVRWGEAPTAAWWALAYTIFFGSVVPYLIFALVMTELTAARVAAFSYVQPVIATGLGVLMMHETLTVKVIVGGVLILVGVYVTERERGEDQVAEQSEKREVHAGTTKP